MQHLKKKNGLYLCPIQSKKQNLKKAISGAKAFNIKGLNISIPHKQKVINEFDKFDIMINLIGAVNTIDFKDGKAKSYNIECIGVIKAIKGVCDLKDKNIVIVGAGGPVRAIVFQLAIEGVNNIRMMNRRIKKVKSFIYNIKTLLLVNFSGHSKLDDIAIDFSHIDLEFDHAGLDELLKPLSNANILIDTTPIGNVSKY